MIEVIQKPVAAGNWREGSVPRAVRAIVLHVAEGSAESVDSWFSSSKAKVSAHFLVGLDGEIRQYVGIHDVAFHAGVVVEPTWAGLIPGTTNSQTVGIEHEGSGLTNWPEAQLLSSSLLSAWLVERFDFTVDALHFPLHHEIKATKSCPGPKFDRPDYLARVAWWTHEFGPATIHELVQGIR